ncbi:hypothetical protein EON80_09010 [bacterium]|nr:MAG: hypothetical protein EON80_09010 [bacterium]
MLRSYPLLRSALSLLRFRGERQYPRRVPRPLCRGLAVRNRKGLGFEYSAHPYRLLWWRHSIADAARWVALGQPTSVPVQVIATDPVTREGTSDAARLTFLRPSTDTATALTVGYSLGGSAENSDYAALTGSVTFSAGSATASVTVQALNDARAEGTETVVITIAPGEGYFAGELNSATVRLLDRPIDNWRQSHFTESQLNDSSISGDTADPDKDGLSNLAEYALGLNPRGHDSSTIAVPGFDGDRLVMTYPRRKASTDVTLVAEGSSEMKTWSAGAVEFVSKVDEGETERITVRLAAPAAQGFLRLRITK